MKEDLINTIIAKANEVVRASKGGVRFGQAVYNQAYAVNPAVAHLAGTDVDPYHNDDNVNAFLDKLRGKS